MNLASAPADNTLLSPVAFVHLFSSSPITSICHLLLTLVAPTSNSLLFFIINDAFISNASCLLFFLSDSGLLFTVFDCFLSPINDINLLSTIFSSGSLFFVSYASS